MNGMLTRSSSEPSPAPPVKSSTNIGPEARPFPSWNRPGSEWVGYSPKPLRIFKSDGRSSRRHSPAVVIFLCLLTLLIIGLSVRVGVRAADNRSAFRRWQPQLLALSEGVDLSARFNYPNPPIMAVLLEPLAYLPPVLASLVWFYLKAAMAALAVYWTLKLVLPGQRLLRGYSVIAIILLACKPILDDLSHGNVNILILFLVVGTLIAYSARRDWLAGITLSLAIACKITPALFLVYFAWRRSWKTLAGCALGLAIFLWPGVLPSARLGWQENQQQLLSWHRVMVMPYLTEGKVTTEHLNQSLPGLVARLATRSPSFVAWQGDHEVAMRYDNWLDLSRIEAALIVKICMAFFLLLMMRLCSGTERPGSAQLVGEFALISLGMLLFSERTWKHHAVTLLLPMAFVVPLLTRNDLPRKSRQLLITLLTLTMALLIIPGLGGGKDRFEIGANPDLPKMFQVYGAYTGAFLLLLASTALGLFHLRRGKILASIPGGKRSPAPRQGEMNLRPAA